MTAIPPPGPSTETKSNTEALKAATRQAKALEKINKTLAKTANRVVAGLTTIGVVMAKADSFQRRSIAMGTTFNKLISQNSTNLKDLQGGFFLPMSEQMSLLEEGLKGNRENLLKLLVQGKLSDQETRNMIDTMVLLEREGGLSRSATEHLSQTVLKTTDTYKIQSGKLVDSLKALAPTLSKVFLLKSGKFIAEGVTQLGGIIGAANLPLLTKVIEMLTEKSDENMVAMGRLKVIDQSNAIMNARSAKDVIRALQDAAKNADKELRLLTAGTENSLAAARVYGARLDLVNGEQSIAYAQLKRALDEAGFKIEDLSNKALPTFAKSLYEGWLELIKPIELLGTWLLPKVISKLDILIPAIHGLAAALVTSYIFKGIGGVLGALKVFLSSTGPLLGRLASFGGLFLKVIPGIVGILASLASYFGWWEKLFGETQEINKNISEMNSRDKQDRVKPLGQPTFFFQEAQRMMQDELASRVFNRPIDRNTKDREVYLEMLEELKKVRKGISTLNDSTNRVGPNHNVPRKF